MCIYGVYLGGSWLESEGGERDTEEKGDKRKNFKSTELFDTFIYW